MTVSPSPGLRPPPSDLETLSARLADAYEELSLVHRLGGGMDVTRRPADFFRQACLDLLDVTGVRAAGVRLTEGPWRGEGCPPGERCASLYGPLQLPQATVDRLADDLLTALSDDDFPAARAASHHGALLVNRLGSDPRFAWLADAGGVGVAGEVSSLMAVPLRRRGRVFGCLFALDKQAEHSGQWAAGSGRDGFLLPTAHCALPTAGGPADFDSQDAKLLASIAAAASVYLENAMLYEDARGLMMGLLHSLVAAIDAKDPYTCGHSERVAALGGMLARAAGLGEPAADRIHLAGLLHDVGKIGVPDRVLLKTGRLTPEEFDEIKRHPGIGAHILRDVPQLADLLPGVLHHHERYDGRGYPHGLAGEAIPLMGRVLCLADCYDAMTSNRTYRPAMPPELALVEIRKCAGTQFDPALAEAFAALGVGRLGVACQTLRTSDRPAIDVGGLLKAG